MKRLRTLAVLAMTLCLVLGTMAVSVFADYDYTMTVSGGNGEIDGQAVVTCSTAQAATVDPEKNEVIIDGNTVPVKLPDDKYFVIGLKETGYDNSKLLTSEVSLADRKEDVSLVVAYGLKSDMVEYTVRYVNRAGGADLLPYETHYGVQNSKPVVSYKYVDGFLPFAYNLTGTITRGGSNQFIFYYDAVDAEGNVITIVDGGGGAANGAGGAGGAGAGTNIDDGQTPAAGPADTIDLDDGQTPTTDPGSATDIDDGQTPGAGPNWTLIGGGAALVAAIAAIVAFLARRRREEEEEEV